MSKIPMIGKYAGDEAYGEDVAKLIGKATGGAGPRMHTPEQPDYDMIYGMPEDDERREDEEQANADRRRAGAFALNGRGFHGKPPTPQLRGDERFDEDRREVKRKPGSKPKDRHRLESRKMKKADQPPKGWQPAGKKGGYRSPTKVSGRYQYWYPGQPHPKSAKKDAVKVEKIDFMDIARVDKKLGEEVRQGAIASLKVGDKVSILGRNNNFDYGTNLPQKTAMDGFEVTEVRTGKRGAVVRGMYGGRLYSMSALDAGTDRKARAFVRRIEDGKLMERRVATIEGMEADNDSAKQNLGAYMETVGHKVVAATAKKLDEKKAREKELSERERETQEYEERIQEEAKQIEAEQDAEHEETLDKVPASPFKSKADTRRYGKGVDWTKGKLDDPLRMEGVAARKMSIDPRDVPGSSPQNAANWLAGKKADPFWSGVYVAARAHQKTKTGKTKIKAAKERQKSAQDARAPAEKKAWKLYSALYGKTAKKTSAAAQDSIKRFADGAAWARKRGLDAKKAQTIAKRKAKHGRKRDPQAKLEHMFDEDPFWAGVFHHGMKKSMNHEPMDVLRKGEVIPQLLTEEEMRDESPRMVFPTSKLHKGARGGKYYKKIQSGTTPKGKPKYRYFYDKKSYEKHMAKKGEAPHVDGHRAAKETKSQKAIKHVQAALKSGKDMGQARAEVMEKFGYDKSAAGRVVFDAKRAMETPRDRGKAEISAVIRTAGHTDRTPAQIVGEIKRIARERGMTETDAMSTAHSAMKDMKLDEATRGIVTLAHDATEKKAMGKSNKVLITRATKIAKKYGMSQKQAQDTLNAALGIKKSKGKMDKEIERLAKSVGLDPEDLTKAKYKSRKKVNGKWRYEYDDKKGGKSKKHTEGTTPSQATIGDTRQILEISRKQMKENHAAAMKLLEGTPPNSLLSLPDHLGYGKMVTVPAYAVAQYGVEMSGGQSSSLASEVKQMASNESIMDFLHDEFEPTKRTKRTNVNKSEDKMKDLSKGLQAYATTPVNLTTRTEHHLYLENCIHECATLAKGQILKSGESTLDRALAYFETVADLQPSLRKAEEGWNVVGMMRKALGIESEPLVKAEARSFMDETFRKGMVGETELQKAPEQHYHTIRSNGDPRAGWADEQLEKAKAHSEKWDATRGLDFKVG